MYKKASNDPRYLRRGKKPTNGGQFPFGAAPAFFLSITSSSMYRLSHTHTHTPRPCMCNWIRVKTIFEKIPIRLLVSTSLTSVYCKQFVCTSMTTGKKPSSTQHTQNLTLIFFPYELKMKLHYYSILYTIISWVYDKSKLCLSIHTYLF